MDNGDPRFPYPRYLKVPFVFVPDGNPLPLEWMAAHPNYVTISAAFIPDPPREPNMGLEPQTRAEGELELLQDVGTFEVVIDYAGNWTIRPVPQLTPQPAPWAEPPSAWPQDPQPEEQTYEEPAPEPEIEPEPPPPRPAYLRCVPPPGPRRARGGPPPLGPNPAARGMDPLAPEFTPNLVRKTARIMAGMDRVIRPGGIATDEGLSAAVHAGMRHLAAHKGDVRAAIASAKAAGAGHGSKPAADHAHVAVAASASASGAKLLSEVAAGLESAAGVAETVGIGLAAAIVLAPTAAGPGEEAALRAYRAGHAGTAAMHGFEPLPPSPPLPGLVPPPLPQRRPGEGGFTPAPPTPPLPGFTPSLPYVPVHPGRPAEANKPIIVSHSDKPAKRADKAPLPPARADERGVRRYNPDVPSHEKAAAAEAELASKVHGMPDQQVVVWGGPIGSHGADVISVDTKTGAVTLWDAKYRGQKVRIGASTTFKPDTPARANAIRQAIAAINSDKMLSPEIREKAIKNLDEGKLTTITTGFGNAKNSVIGR